MSDHVWWYLARAAGMVTLGASSATVIWGLMLSTRVVRRRSLPKWLLDLHRFLGALTVAFLALHVGALVADSNVHFGTADVLVPLAADWRPIAVAAGVVAGYLVIAVEFTSLVKKWIPRRVWSGVHLSSAVAFVLSVAHTVAAGTDVANRAFVVGGFLLAVVVLFLFVVRIGAAVSPAPRPTRPVQFQPQPQPQNKGATTTWT